jgi:hypothetical protein
MGLILLLTLVLGVLLHQWADQPLYRPAGIRTLEPYAPFGLGDDHWRALPFFYLYAAWPDRFNERPLGFALPYEKAPPSHFLGHVLARYLGTSITMTWEGPRSPLEGVSSEKLKECMLHWAFDPECLRIRRLALKPTLQEIQERMNARLENPTLNWRAEWFEVNNPQIDVFERPRGVYLEVRGQSRGQSKLEWIEEWYIYYLKAGTLQAISLSRPAQGADAALASALFLKSVRSSRVSADLGVHKVYGMRELSRLNLNKILSRTQAKTPEAIAERVRQISGAHQVLLSYVSVNPASLDAFFHLGGTATELARDARKSKDAEVSAWARSVLSSSSQYVRDIEPTSPKAAQLQTLWLEVKSY